MSPHFRLAIPGVRPLASFKASFTHHITLCPNTLPFSSPRHFALLFVLGQEHFTLISDQLNLPFTSAASAASPTTRTPHQRSRRASHRDRYVTVRTAYMADEDPTLNIPSILTLAVVSFFVIRWFFSSRDGAQGQQSRGRRVDPAQVEHISQMFPQLNQREIMWDLHLNGGSVAATTERILSGRGLDTVSWFPATVFPVPYCQRDSQILSFGSHMR